MKKAEVVKDLVYEEMLSKRLQRDYDLSQKYKLETEEERRQKEEERKQKEEERDHKEAGLHQKRVAILNLQKKGMSVLEIASIFGISEEEVSEFLL